MYFLCINSDNTILVILMTSLNWDLDGYDINGSFFIYERSFAVSYSFSPIESTFYTILTASL